MIVAITAPNASADSAPESRFGRAPYFLIFDEMNTISMVENIYAGSSGGVGPQAVTLLIKKGVKTVITGKIGENAKVALEEAGIAVYSYGNALTVREAFEKFRKDELVRIK